MQVARVLPDEPAINKTFDYSIPAELRGRVQVGSEVRIDLHGRRVGGWVVALDVQPQAGVQLRPIRKLRGAGPPADVLEVARWAAWRWAGKTASLLRTASPPAAVLSLPAPGSRSVPLTVPHSDGGMVADALAAARCGVAVVRWPPGNDVFPLAVGLVSHALSAGGGAEAHPPAALVLCPDVDTARHLGLRMRRAGLEVAIVANDRGGTAAAREWASGAAGGRVVVGSRAAAWAPVPDMAVAVVLDEHDESLKEERTPSWHARDVVVERARRCGAPCLLVSPCPTLEAQQLGPLLAPARAFERAGWPVVDIVDRRHEEPSTARSLISPRLAAAVRSGARVVCVLNRKERARLSACTLCGELARCDACGASVILTSDGRFRCARCAAERPQVCVACGSGAFKLLRPGVSRLRTELRALAGEEVAELTADTAGPGQPVTARVVVGTEAALHRVELADVVAFVDFDQELTAPRYRAAEEALGLLARGARLTGGRGAGGSSPAGRLLVQTRIPDHVVLRAALHADPSRVAKAESVLRAELGFPPALAMAAISGEAAGTFIEGLEGVAGAGSEAGVEVLGPTDGAWLVRAPDHRVLCDALAAVPRPRGRLRVEVDPLRA